MHTICLVCPCIIQFFSDRSIQEQIFGTAQLVLSLSTSKYAIPQNLWLFFIGCYWLTDIARLAHTLLSNESNISDSFVIGFWLCHFLSFFFFFYSSLFTLFIFVCGNDFRLIFRFRELIFAFLAWKLLLHVFFLKRCRSCDNMICWFIDSDWLP